MILVKRPSKLDKMDFSELVQLRDEVESALNGKIAMERRELQGKLAEMDGIEWRSSAKMPAGKGKAGSRSAKLKTTRAPVAPKYRGPDGQLWSGRGLAPRWLVEQEKKGKKREQFLIARP